MALAPHGAGASRRPYRDLVAMEQDRNWKQRRRLFGGRDNVSAGFMIGERRICSPHQPPEPVPA
jgi:hypothetical protein